MQHVKLAPLAGQATRLTPEAAWAAAWIEAQSLVRQLQAAIARGDIALRARHPPGSIVSGVCSATKYILSCHSSEVSA